MRTMWILVVAHVLAVAGPAAADVPQCMWGGRFYGPQAISCQNGQQSRCVDGRWQKTGSECAGGAADPSGEEDQPGVVRPPLDAD